MFQGTSSNAGKTLTVAALCNLLSRKGYRVTPFKSQNMSLNSYTTLDNDEMSIAQVMQAEAAGIEPICHMNPILLKPKEDFTSQVIVQGKPAGDMRFDEYQQEVGCFSADDSRTGHTLSGHGERIYRHGLVASH
jgi:adenosylcobyric acid synthase